MRNLLKKITDWAVETPLIHKRIKNNIAGVILHVIRSKKGTVIFYRDEERRKTYDLIYKIREATHTGLTDDEIFMLVSCVRSVEKVQGDMAEVGVFQGGSAKVISSFMSQGKELFLFDTFEGLPETTQEKLDYPHKKGDLPFPYEKVKDLFSNRKDVIIYKGIFPESATPVERKTFSFVHFDVDTYESTKACLEFFYPRITSGGCILSHDYVNLKGVKKAFDDFFQQKTEVVLQVASSQCLVIKS